MAAGIVVPGRAYCQNCAAGVIAAGWPCTAPAAAPATTRIIRSADGCMLLEGEKKGSSDCLVVGSDWLVYIAF